MTKTMRTITTVAATRISPKSPIKKFLGLHSISPYSHSQSPNHPNSNVSTLQINLSNNGSNRKNDTPVDAQIISIGTPKMQSKRNFVNAREGNRKSKKSSVLKSKTSIGDYTGGKVGMIKSEMMMQGSVPKKNDLIDEKKNSSGFTKYCNKQSSFSIQEQSIKVNSFSVQEKSIKGLPSNSDISYEEVSEGKDSWDNAEKDKKRTKDLDEEVSSRSSTPNFSIQVFEENSINHNPSNKNPSKFTISPDSDTNSKLAEKAIMGKSPKIKCRKKPTVKDNSTSLSNGN